MAAESDIEAGSPSAGADAAGEGQPLFGIKVEQEVPRGFTKESWFTKVQDDSVGAERAFQDWSTTPPGKRFINRLRAPPGQGRDPMTAKINARAKADHARNTDPSTSIPEFARDANSALRYRAVRQRLSNEEMEQVQFARDNMDVIDQTEAIYAGIGEAARDVVSSAFGGVALLPIEDRAPVIAAIEAASAGGRAGFAERLTGLLEPLQMTTFARSTVMKLALKRIIPLLPPQVGATVGAVANVRAAMDGADAFVPREHWMKRYMPALKALATVATGGAMGVYFNAHKQLENFPSIPWMRMLEELSTFGDPEEAVQTRNAAIEETRDMVADSVAAQAARQELGLTTDMNQHAVESVGFLSDVAEDKGYPDLAKWLEAFKQTLADGGYNVAGAGASAGKATLNWLLNSTEAVANGQTPPPPPETNGGTDGAGGAGGADDPAAKLLESKNTEAFGKLLKKLSKDQKKIIISKSGAMADSFRARFAKTLFGLGAGTTNPREIQGLARSLVSRDMQLDRQRNALMMTQTAKSNTIRNSLRFNVPQNKGSTFSSLIA